MIYLDNAATTVRKPEQVAAAMVQALQEWGNSSRGVHSTSLQAARGIYKTRCRIAEFFGCRRREGLTAHRFFLIMWYLQINNIISKKQVVRQG